LNGPVTDVTPLRLSGAVDRHGRLMSWRGATAIVFGLLIFLWPHLTLRALTLLWGGYSSVDGVLVLGAAIAARAGTPRLLLGLVGAAGLACAGAVLAAPETIAPLLVAIVSAWAIVTGALQVWVARELRKAVEGEWILALDGAGAIAFGVALALWPRLHIAALVWLIGCFAILLGTFYLAVGTWLARRG
jgi:uncharacterized membrane protein HdeD (DUF308 family)